MLDEDLRPLLFSGCAWYQHLDEHAGETWAAWRVTRSTEPAWWYGCLNAAAAFARLHGLLPLYRKRFQGIGLGDLTRSRAARDRRAVTFPIWEIANELIVGTYLEAVAGWTVVVHEPSGHCGHKGDWEFQTPSGRKVFVEVKSLADPERDECGVYSRAPETKRLQAVLKGAYRQLPDDERATLVVVVGDEPIRIPHGIAFGDLFQALNSVMQVRMRVLPFVEESVVVGPSFRERFAHGGKNRRLGAVAGMVITGSEEPQLGFYVIHNPYAKFEVRIAPRDFGDARQFVVDDEGRGEERDGLPPDQAWRRIADTWLG